MASKNEILYKTSPRLFILCAYFFGSVFFGLLACLVWLSSNRERTPLILSFFGIFVAASLVTFFYFISIRIIKLANDRIVVSYIFIPFHKTILFPEIRDITQKSREVSNSNYFSSGFSFTELTTKIILEQGKKAITLYTISTLDFDELRKGFHKMKNGNRKFSPPNKSLLLYVVDNLDGIFWGLFFLIITMGLGYGLLTMHPK